MPNTIIQCDQPELDGVYDPKTGRLVTDFKDKKVHFIIPSTFAESMFELDGRPFRLDTRNYLKPIYDADIEEGIIMSGRQVEKSTTNSTKMATMTLMKPHFKALYFAPLTSQVKEFSKERLGKLYEYSQNDIVKRQFIDKDDSQAVYFKEFSNGSANYFKHCYGLGDNIRGITVNGIWGDEIQDIHIDAIPVIKECQSHAMDAGARMKVTWFTGTPKTFSNTIQQWWDRSTQNEWVIRCDHCNKYQIMGLKNISPDKFLCASCRMELTKSNILRGMWLELQPGKDLKGYRISQLMVPWIEAKDIWAKYQTYSRDKFFNEVLGRSYENANKPFTLPLLYSNANNNYPIYTSRHGEFANADLYMGIDWGTGTSGYTVVTIGAYNNDGQFQILYVKRYETGDELDTEWQVDDISRLMQHFRITYCIADWGFGYVQNQTLKKKFGDRFDACYYSFNQGESIVFNPDKKHWVVNRTDVIKDYIDMHTDHIIALPGKEFRNNDKFKFYFDDHLAIQAEYRTSRNGRSEDLMYTHPDGTPDDTVHSGVYVMLASKLAKSFYTGNISFAGAYSR